MIWAASAPAVWAQAAAPRAAQTPSGLPVPRFVSLRHAKVNARVGPSMEHPIKWTFQRKGLPVQITAETSEWRRIRDPDGGVAWVRREMLSGTRTVLVTAHAEVILRKRPDATAAARATVAPGVVAVLKSCAAGWCAVKASGREGWLPAAHLWGLEVAEARGE